MPTSNSIAERVRSLIDRVHGGSVNAAARDTGIPQRTLARIADGTVENPRADALQRLATFYKASLEWLLSGQGEGPQHPLGPDTREGNEMALREILRVNMLQKRLKLSRNAAGAITVFPSAVAAAAMSLHESVTGKGPFSLRLLPYMANERENWLDFVDKATEVYGEDKVARWLEGNWKQIVARFTTASSPRKSS
jgi:transcriptional regulator with XRE-family HTH domain